MAWLGLALAQAVAFDLANFFYAHELFFKQTHLDSMYIYYLVQ